VTSTPALTSSALTSSWWSPPLVRWLSMMLTSAPSVVQVDAAGQHAERATAAAAAIKVPNMRDVMTSSLA
jgi:hypothetical protein